MNTNKTTVTSSSTSVSSSSASATSFTTTSKVILPTERIEIAPVVHEEIKTERITEVQPLVNVEKYQTEIHQITQPLLDKEVLPVQIAKITDATEVLPEVLLQNATRAAARDVSTVNIKESAVVVEKAAVYNEVDKKKIIEEIQPVIYKETVVPEVIQETKPFFQRVVEGPHYSQVTEATQRSANYDSLAVDFSSVPRQNLHRETVFEQLATERVELPAAVHESIRKERVTEVQPVINVEKIHTEVIQKTQPLMDKEIRAIAVQQRSLATEVLPEVVMQSKGNAWARDVSTVEYRDSAAVVVEKPTIVNEIEKLKIVEEIQPVVYKEVIVPEIIQETRPMYQKIVEGTVYTHEVLAPQQLSGTKYHYPTSYVATPIAPLPTATHVTVKETVVAQPVKVAPAPKTLVEEVTTTTTTTTTGPVQRI